MSSSKPNEYYEMTEAEKKDAEKCKNIAKKKTTAYMKNVREYLKERNGGKLEKVWDLDLDQLSEYYYTYIYLSEQIRLLPALTVKSRYGDVPAPLLSARDKVAYRLEALQKSMGLSLKAGKQMNMVEPVREESAVEAFLKGKLTDKEQNDK